jgi:hypothetical protein
LNFIFGIVCLFVCVCAFSLRRESPDMILGDKPLIFEVVLSQEHQKHNCFSSYRTSEKGRRVQQRNGGGGERDREVVPTKKNEPIKIVM